jgi:molybdopterin-guanine dinucleotide biosynthesis protein A
MQKVDYSDIVAVVMAGGRSKRMGQDKGLIQYKNKAHRYYMADMLKTVFSEVVISVPIDFVLPEKSEYSYVKDVVENLGPLGGLYSLFKAFPDKSILIIATDMPEVEVRHVTNLLENRATDSVATCYKNSDGFVEPLFAIWENSASRIIDGLIKENKLSMRMIIKNHKAKIIDIPDEKALLNINTEEEKDKYLGGNK